MAKECLHGFTHLSRIDFEPWCELSRIRRSPFLGCTADSSICIPFAVEVLSISSFCGCSAFSRVAFESDSQLKVIKERAFSPCAALCGIGAPPLSKPCSSVASLNAFFFAR
jgi:hypothetical protein